MIAIFSKFLIQQKPYGLNETPCFLQNELQEIWTMSYLSMHAFA